MPYLKKIEFKEANHANDEHFITKGLESGQPQDFDIDAFKQRMLNTLADE